jgi:hypothetical protein
MHDDDVAGVPTGKVPEARTLPRRRMVWLFAGHVAVGLIATVAMRMTGPGPQPPFWGYAYVGLIFGQTSLLGIWTSLATSPWWMRMIGGAVGSGFLAILLGVGVDELSSETIAVVLMAAGLVIFVLLVVRCFRIVIRQESQPIFSATRIQFSIRHLMVLTFVIACLVTLGKLAQAFLPNGDIYFRLLLFAVTGGVVGILPVWFILAAKRPLPYGGGVVLVGAFAGFCIGLRDMFDPAIWMSVTTTEAIAVVASLLVVRHCGYRLVRLPSRSLQ